MRRVVLSVLVVVSLAQAEMIRIDDKEVVVDTETGLMWQDNSDTKTIRKTWQGAMDYCKNLSFAGYSDWYLPDVDTLKIIYSNKNKLVNIVSDHHWSSSTNSSLTAWNVYFGNGYTQDVFRAYNNYIRCVRDSTLNFNSLSSFLEHLRASIESNNTIILSSIHDNKSVEFFNVAHNGKNYLGTQNNVFVLLGIKKPQFSKTPFVSTQQTAQTRLIDYLTLPLIPKPTLPPALNLTKDEFESKAEFAERVQKESAKREATIATLQDDYRRKVEERNNELEKRKASAVSIQKVFLFRSFQDVMGEPKLSIPTFDSETSTMYVTVSMSNANWSKKVAIPMSDKVVAKSFKENISKATPSVTFGYEKDSFMLKSINVGFEDKKYIATLTDKDYQPEKVAVTLENKKVEFLSLQNPNLTDRYQVQALGYSESAGAKGQKFDDDIPAMLKSVKSAPVDSKKWLFVVGIEKYDETDNIAFAKRSAELFAQSAQKSLGISERHTYQLIDNKATSGAIKDKLSLLLSDVKDGDTIYFYYNGHGIPDPSKNGEPYMLPSDKIPDFITREEEFSLKQIYKKLGDSKASKVFAFVDSCFSGATDGKSLIKGVAAARFQPKEVTFDHDKMVVMTAGRDKQYSNMYEAKGHRMFSYFFIKSMLEGKNNATDIFKEVSYKTSEASNELGAMKKQEPTIAGNERLSL